MTWWEGRGEEGGVGEGAVRLVDGRSRGRYHGGRRPSSDDSFHSPTLHSIIGIRQTEYQEALPSSVNDEVRCDCTFADDGNAL